MKPRLLDLFCGAGGCPVGYARAGFEAVGVDIEPHPDYPFDLTVADAMEVLADADYLRTFDVVHASPPCPRYSSATKATGTSDQHPDLLPAVRAALVAAGVTWVIENVEGAPMPDAFTICGYAMGLPTMTINGITAGLSRHRLFESSEFILSPGCACDSAPKASIFGHSGSLRINGRNTAIRKEDAVRLLGVEWMTNRDDIADAIPPAYTEFIGGQLMDALVAA